MPDHDNVISLRSRSGPAGSCNHVTSPLHRLVWRLVAEAANQPGLVEPQRWIQKQLKHTSTDTHALQCTHTAHAHTPCYRQPTQTPVASFAINKLIKMFSWENVLVKPWVYCNETQH